MITNFLVPFESDGFVLYVDPFAQTEIEWRSGSITFHQLFHIIKGPPHVSLNDQSNAFWKFISQPVINVNFIVCTGRIFHVDPDETIVFIGNSYYFPDDSVTSLFVKQKTKHRRFNREIPFD